MRFTKSAALASLFALSVSTALAADPPQEVLYPRPVTRENPETWYLRGDVGFVDHDRPEADFAAAPSAGDFLREGFGDTGVLGVGIGYRFSPNFRADVTVDHRFNTRFKGLSNAPDFAAGSLTDHALFHSSAAMLNGYVDLGLAPGIAPYIGAGLGVSRNVLSNYARTTIDAATGLATWERVAGGDDYSLAWALMAGVGFKLSSSFTLDLGYRYIDLGDVKTREYADGAGADVKSIAAHEVRFGVRYALQ